MLGLFISAALACAGLVHEAGALAESGASQTVFDVGDGEVTVTYEVVYEGDAGDFGWIVPVPAAVLSVEEGDADRLVALAERTAPEVYQDLPAEAPRGGCFSRATKGGADNTLEGRNGDVVVLVEGFTGTYSYIVVEATDSQALTAWADAGGWSLSGVEADLQHYVELGHPFVLVELRPEALALEPTALPPLAIRYASEEVRFPSVMARHGEAQRSTVYVVGDSRAELVAGWTHEDLDEVYDVGEATEVFDARLSELGADRTWGRTWSGEGEGAFLTRFDLLAEAALHDRDAVFGFDGTTVASSTTIRLGVGSQSWVLLPLGLLMVGWRRRRA